MLNIVIKTQGGTIQDTQLLALYFLLKAIDVSPLSQIKLNMA